MLRQADVDQLVRAIKEGKIPTSKDSLVPLQSASRLDVRDPAWTQERVIRRRLPVLDLVFDRLGPAAQVTLTKSLRFPIRSEGASIELAKFGELRRRFDKRPCLYHVVRLDPLRGLGVMLFDPAILYALVDALMGGLGVGEYPEDREVSEIEENLLRRAHLDVLRDFESAWKPWFPLKVEQVRCDRATQVASTISDEEVCHIGKIMVAGDALPASPIFFVMPYSSLEPLFEATSLRSGEEIDLNWRVNLVQNLRSADAELRAVLGGTDITTRRLRELAVGDMLQLERLVEDEIDVLVEGRPTLKGRLGQINHNYAVKVTSRRKYGTALQDRTAGQVLVRKGLITREQLAVALVDEHINRRQLLDSIVDRGWVERRVLEAALHS